MLEKHLRLDETSSLKVILVTFPMNEAPFSKPNTMVLFLKILVTFVYIKMNHSTSKKAAGVAGPLRALPNVRILQRRIRVKRQRLQRLGRRWAGCDQKLLGNAYISHQTGKGKSLTQYVPKGIGYVIVSSFGFFLGENVL